MRSTMLFLESFVCVRESFLCVFKGSVVSMQADDLDKGDGVFANIAPCQPLLEILTDTPDPATQQGNFTEHPTVELLQGCSSSSAAYMLNGDDLADAIAQPLPLIKVRTFALSTPTRWIHMPASR